MSNNLPVAKVSTLQDDSDPPRLTPPYYAAIFSSLRSPADDAGYADASARMMDLARQQQGYLGVESVRGGDGIGITISYWTDTDAIRRWKEEAEHLAVQKVGQRLWYDWYSLRIAKVEREYQHKKKSD